MGDFLFIGGVLMALVYDSIIGIWRVIDEKPETNTKNNAITLPYYKVVEQVRKVNNDAAEYMIQYAKDYPDLVRLHGYNEYDLQSCFNWNITNQGWDFWNNIHNEIIYDMLAQ
jgi:hypothetical protein